MEQLRYISFVATLLFSASSWAQTPLRFTKYIGISGGLASNILSGSEIDSQKKVYGNNMAHRTGPTFSVFLKKELNSWFYLKYELSYIRKGNVSSNNALWNLNLEYISVPARFGIQPINLGRTSKHFQLGIEGGFSFNYAPGHATDNLAQAFSSVNATVRKWAIGALAGLNLEYRLSLQRILFINTTWYSDLTPLISYQTGNATYKAGNNGVIFAAGLTFPLH
jgi:hypothetical protein